MSSMLEQAIIDAGALREAALKNAEQSIIEKYAPEIKAAVETLLGEAWKPRVGETVIFENNPHKVIAESDNGKVKIQKTGQKAFVVKEAELSQTDGDLLKEEEMMGIDAGGAAPPFAMDQQIPGAYEDGLETCACPDEEDEVELTFTIEDLKDFVEAEAGGEPEGMGGDVLDLEAGPPGEPAEFAHEDLLDDEEDDLLKLQENKEEAQLKEIMDVLSEMDKDDKELLEDEEEDDDLALQEELIVDMMAEKDGTFQTNESALKLQQERELARRESDEWKQENEALEKRLKEMSESKRQLEKKLKLFKSTTYKLNEKLQSTLLMNAKLLYSNRVLKDASLNERQKQKIVEVINKARSVEEAKNLQETLRTTVGSTKQKGPQSLSESIQRKSSVSSMLTSKRHETPEIDNFSERMRKLAGIK